MNRALSRGVKALRPHFGLGSIVILAAFLRLWRLDRNGWGTEYYAASVRSMLESWHNFLFNAFDPAGFVSLDKPPVAFWIQAASARLLGFSAFSLLLPQVLEGVGSILILHHLVRRRFGAPAGLLAALFLALTPISVAVDRTNNTDACLVFTLLLAAWALSVAVERGDWRWLVAALALVGIGFNVKMLAACVVLPGFAALYLYAAPIGAFRRIAHLAGAGAVFAAIALSWSAAYDLTAPENRPYVDSTDGNSMLELAIGHNGLDRFVPGWERIARQPVDAATQEDRYRAGRALGWYYHLNNIPTGPLRLVNPHLAGQVLWLLPLALVGFVVALFRTGLRRPVPPEATSLLLWFGWAATYAMVYSVAGGIFFAYYLVMLGPPLAALAGIGVSRLGESRRWAALLLPIALAATAGWQARIEAPYLGGLDWRQWLFWAMIVGTALGVFGLVAAAWPGLAETRRRSLAHGAVAISLAALLVTPLAWALSVVIGRGGVSSPAASIALLVPPGELRELRPRNIDIPRPAPPKLLDFLTAHEQRDSYLVALRNSRIAAPLVIATGKPVLSIGGFNGTDPILTPETLAALVLAGQLRYALLTEPDSLERFYGAPAIQQKITDWIMAHGRIVDPAEWRADPSTEFDADERRPSGDLNRGQLWDLRPDPVS